MARKGDSDYFRLPNVFVMALIATGMTLLAMCVYVPWRVPYHSLGFIGDIAWYLAYVNPRLGEGIWYVAVAIHVSEAIYAFHLAGQKGIYGRTRIMWFVSTLCFGIGSLWYLLKYDSKVLSIVQSLLHEFADDVEHDPPKEKSEFVTVIEIRGDDDVQKLAL